MIFIGCRRHRGSSVLELIVVMAICSILLTQAVIKVHSYRQPSLTRSTKELLTTLNTLSLISYHRRSNLELTFSTAQQKLELACTPSCRREHILLPKFHDRRIFITSAKFGNFLTDPQTLVLYPNGSASPGKIVIKNQQGDVCAITQAVSGRRHYECS